MMAGGNENGEQWPAVSLHNLEDVSSRQAAMAGFLGGYVFKASPTLVKILVFICCLPVFTSSLAAAATETVRPWLNSWQPGSGEGHTNAEDDDEYGDEYDDEYDDGDAFTAMSYYDDVRRLNRR